MTKNPCLCSGMQPPQPQLTIESLHAIILSLNHAHFLRNETGTEVHSSCSSSPACPSASNSEYFLVIL